MQKENISSRGVSRRTKVNSKEIEEKIDSLAVKCKIKYIQREKQSCEEVVKGCGKTTLEVGQKRDGYDI